MDPSPEVLGGLLFAAAVGLLYLSRARVRPETSATETEIEHLLHDLEAGICPRCEAVHPEALDHAGPNGFWTVLKCPECGYTMSAHVHHRQDD